MSDEFELNAHFGCADDQCFLFFSEAADLQACAPLTGQCSAVIIIKLR